MKVCFGTYKNPNILNKLVMWAVGSKWTHCWLETEQLLNGSYITIEDSPNGGAKLNLEGYENTDHEKYECLSTNEDITVLYPYLNTRYGWFHALGFGLCKILKLKHNPVTGDLVCSGLVATWLKSSPVSDEFKNIEINDATPTTLYNIICKSFYFRKL